MYRNSGAKFFIKGLFLIVWLNLLAKVTFSQTEPKPANIILMIGDGMGFAQISAAYYVNDMQLNMLTMPVSGLMSIHAYNDLVADSGASGTAISSGVKTYNGAIGVDKDTLPVQSILTYLSEKGKRTGIVVTCAITHATPAAFYAHQPSRKMEEAIASDFLDSGIAIAIGGGRRFFEKRKSDNRNLVKELQANGYSVRNLDQKNPDFKAVGASNKIVLFTADQDPAKSNANRTYLPDATAFAIDHLSSISDSGFFLMVEGSQIDWGGHDNDTDYILSETLDFDRAVGKALAFAKKDGNTLVIVMADHETGGMALNKNPRDKTFQASYTSKEHTAVFVPVLAFGPGASFFSGFYDNTQVNQKLISLTQP
jgi:alkaline phosphatase